MNNNFLSRITIPIVRKPFKVSAVVLCYNGEKYLKKRLKRRLKI